MELYVLSYFLDKEATDSIIHFCVERDYHVQQSITQKVYKIET